jgi:hypothetical protein
MNEDGCPLDTRQFPQPTLLLEKLVPLWENTFNNWSQILGRAPNGRLYFREERELIWANPSIRLPLPHNLVHALKYLIAVLASTNIAR